MVLFVIFRTFDAIQNSADAHKALHNIFTPRVTRATSEDDIFSLSRYTKYMNDSYMQIIFATAETEFVSLCKYYPLLNVS